MNQCGHKNSSEILTEHLVLVFRLHYFPPTIKDQVVVKYYHLYYEFSYVEFYYPQDLAYLYRDILERHVVIGQEQRL